MDVYDMSRGEFLTELSTRTTPANVYQYAPQIYTYLSGLFQQGCEDSVLREWAFQWATEQTNADYEVIYQRWLGGEA